MKKFSRMPRSEGGGLGGTSGSGSSSGVSSYYGKVFAVGRFQVTVDELVAEGMYNILALQRVLDVTPFTLRAVIFSGTHPPAPIWREAPPRHSSESTPPALVLLWARN